jgi:Flp pilus assembly protein TadG
MRTGMERRRRRRSMGGQGLVEFAIVCPIAILIVLAILSGSWLFFQNEAVVDGSRGGARAASIEGPAPGTSSPGLYSDPTNSGTFCETGYPTTIAFAVAHAAPQLAVNPSILCASVGSQTHMVEKTAAPGKASITVDATPTLAAPASVTVTVSFSAQGLAPPLNRSFTFTASSVQPMLKP